MRCAAPRRVVAARRMVAGEAVISLSVQRYRIDAYFLDAPPRAPRSRPLAPPPARLRAAARLAPRHGQAPAQRARGRRRGAGGPPALARLAHVARPDRRAGRAGQPAALRAARRVLHAVSRAAAEVLVLPLAPAGRRPRRRRGGDARADLRARRDRRRNGHPRPRLRLGLAGAVARRALPRRARRRPVQLAGAARAHRGRARPPRVHEPRARHRRRQPVRARPRLRPHRLDRDVRAHAQLEGAAAAHRRPVEARRAGLRARLLPSQPRLPLRRHLGRRAVLHRRHDAVARPHAALPGRPRRPGPLGGLGHALRAHAACMARAAGRPLPRGARGPRSPRPAGARRAGSSPHGGCS